MPLPSGPMFPPDLIILIEVGATNGEDPWAMRLTLSARRFDRGCWGPGLGVLRQFRTEGDAKQNFEQRPTHDRSGHSADDFRDRARGFKLLGPQRVASGRSCPVAPAEQRRARRL